MNIYLEGDTHTARMARPVAAPTAVRPTTPAVETPSAAVTARHVAAAAAATGFAVTVAVARRRCTPATALPTTLLAW